MAKNLAIAAIAMFKADLLADNVIQKTKIR
jgi:hypothetical protein